MLDYYIASQDISLPLVVTVMTGITMEFLLVLIVITGITMEFLLMLIVMTGIVMAEVMYEVP